MTARHVRLMPSHAACGSDTHVVVVDILGAWRRVWVDRAKGYRVKTELVADGEGGAVSPDPARDLLI